MALATNLLSNGIQNGKGDQIRQVKYSVAVKGSLPLWVKVFTDQAYVSEDKALSERMNKVMFSKKGS